MFIRVYIVLFLYINEIYSYKCDFRLALDITKGKIINNTEIIHNGLTYRPDQYFTYKVEEQKWILGCPCLLKHCYRKCCPKEKFFAKVNSKKTCVSGEKSKIYTKMKIFKEMMPQNLSLQESFIEIHDMSCPSGHTKRLDPTFTHDIFLQKNGSLMYLEGNIEYWVPPEKFCMEIYDLEDFKALTALICLEEDEIKQGSTTRVAYASG